MVSAGDTGINTWLIHTIVSKIGALVATCQRLGINGICASVGWPIVHVLCLEEIVILICSCCLSLATHKIVVEYFNNAEMLHNQETVKL